MEFGRYGDGWKLKEGKLYVQHIGLLSYKISQSIPEPKHLIVVFDGLDYWAIISGELTKGFPVCAENAIGIDMGMKTFATLSSGEKIEHPTPYLKSLKKIQREQHRLNRTEDKARKELLRKRLRKIHKKIKNQRTDFLHKASRSIVNAHSAIFVEDLSVKKMKSFSNYNRKQADLAWMTFLNMLQYKAESAGRVFVKVNPAYTTQTCRKCGHIQKIELSERTYVCPVCGHEEDRDIMAAKNILAVGLYGLGAAKAAS